MSHGSTNARPFDGALTDETLRRSGVRDLSDENRAGNSNGYERVPMNIPEPQNGGLQQVITTDQQLQLGVPPSRIDRLNNSRIFADIGPSSMGGFAVDRSGERMRVGHVPMSHPVTPAQPNYPTGATYADLAYIPAIRIGDPL